MSPRMGRPTNDPKGNYTGIRLSDDEVRKLEVCMKKTGLSKTGVIRQGVNTLYTKLERMEERSVGMHSFYDVHGNVISFENRAQLHLELQKDIVSGKITAYLVECDDTIYQVDKRTYDVLDEM